MKPISATTIAVAVGVALLAALFVGYQLRDDDTSTARESTSSTEGDPTPADAAPLDFGQEPEVSRQYKDLALQSVADGMITMVPTLLPEGWKNLGGGYQESGPQWWHMVFEAPSGPATLDQRAGSRDTVLADHEDQLTAQDDVDLTKWGTGIWTQATTGDTTVLYTEVKGSTVVVQAPDLDTASDLAKSLLPAEDSKSSEG